MSNLVKRLRDDSWVGNALGQADLRVWHSTCVEAADRIEELEGKLERNDNENTT